MGNFFTKKTLLDQARNLGLKPGDCVMIHASLRKVGEILGGADSLIDVLLEAVHPGGALLVYVGCESPFDELGREPFSKREYEKIEKNMVPFNPKTARANRTFGAFAEVFRSRPEAKTSRQIGARFSAIGEKANWLLRDQPQNFGFGKNSPLDKLYWNGGKVLLIGSDPDQATVLHLAEYLAPIRDKRIVRYKTLLQDKDKAKWVEVKEFDTGNGIKDWPDQFFGTIVEKFIQREGIISKKMGTADCYVLKAKPLVDFAIGEMVQISPKEKIYENQK